MQQYFVFYLSSFRGQVREMFMEEKTEGFWRPYMLGPVAVWTGEKEEREVDILDDNA